MEKIRAGAPAVLFRLSRNFGHANAICAGLDHASADLVAFLDADLQDRRDGLEMVDKARDGYNVVFGLRRKRKENVLEPRTAYWTFYRLVALLSTSGSPSIAAISVSWIIAS